MADAGVPAAFFDVDGTLTTETTMFGILRYHFARLGKPDQSYVDARAALRALAGRLPREEVCRAYYRLYAGADAAELAAQGRAWFREGLDAGGFFRDDAMRAFREHGEAGHLRVLVSGSFPVCLDPIAELLGADVVFCSRPEVARGRCTGEVDTPMIGKAKAVAVTELALRRGIDLAASSAYGDHESDLPLLETVGRPVVVGDDEAMAREAAERGWLRLAAPAATSDQGR